MTDANYPAEDRALALIERERFCEFLDATDALSCGWPHSRTSARRWLEAQCEIDSLGQLATDPEAAAAFDKIVRRFDAWDRNRELPV